jgi:hypothetical protein
MVSVRIREKALAMSEVRSIANLLGTPVSFAYAVKADPWIFLTGHKRMLGRPGHITIPRFQPETAVAARPLA